MNTIKILLNVLLFVSISACSQAQGDIPKEVKEAFEKKYPSHKDVEWNVDDHGFYEADFKLDGEKYRADFEKSGVWVETENSIKYDDLPDVVKDVIKEGYDKDEITEIEHVQNAEKGEFFDVEFKRKGKNKDVMITPSGKIIH
ncbi:PepSY-like domain-containing protein [Fulvivirga ligni]|uniref:PepSY-like domain-containing protein n=1 Tax=Fulvivirga ligni TaxID=2904246 RepID=UPI001F3C54B2|nr:PepSY-like domain-containing protein [Fulvivirga ligni]UII19517.1 PepSY-like domain-containing protein [Fulvivirga ligni]